MFPMQHCCAVLDSWCFLSWLDYCNALQMHPVSRLNCGPWIGFVRTSVMSACCHLSWLMKHQGICYFSYYLLFTTESFITAACFPCLQLWSSIYSALLVVTLKPACLRALHAVIMLTCSVCLSLYGLMTLQPLHCDGWNLRLMIERFAGWLQTISLSGNNSGQVVYTYLPLSPSSIIHYHQKAVLLWCSQDNCKLGWK